MCENLDEILANIEWGGGHSNTQKCNLFEKRTKFFRGISLLSEIAKFEVNKDLWSREFFFAAQNFIGVVLLCRKVRKGFFRLRCGYP